MECRLLYSHCTLSRRPGVSLCWHERRMRRRFRFRKHHHGDGQEAPSLLCHPSAPRAEENPTSQPIPIIQPTSVVGEGGRQAGRQAGAGSLGSWGGGRYRQRKRCDRCAVATGIVGRPPEPCPSLNRHLFRGRKLNRTWNSAFAFDESTSP